MQVLDPKRANSVPPAPCLKLHSVALQRVPITESSLHCSICWPHVRLLLSNKAELRQMFSVFDLICGFSAWFLCLLVSKPCFLNSSTQNHVEPAWNYLKKSALDPKYAKLYQKSDFGHVRTHSWLDKLRNLQRKIQGKYLGHINMKRNIYKECP